MVVLVPVSSGFCPGVKRAEEGVFKLRNEREGVNLFGPLIHNQNYIQMLKTRNIKSVNPEELPAGETLVIRTHGISRHEEKKLAEKFVLKDLTCPIVKRVQRRVEKASGEKAFVIISGKLNHAEVQGLVSYADYYAVIENHEELENFLKNPSIPAECEKIFILSQTTHSKAFFETLCSEIKKHIKDIPIESKDTVCPITENKEKESLDLQKEADFTVVIGDPHSSNSKKLYNILKGGNTLFVQNLADLNNQKQSWQGVKKVLVVSSTSTPRFIEKEIVSYLEGIDE